MQLDDITGVIIDVSRQIHSSAFLAVDLRALRVKSRRGGGYGR